MSSVASLPVQGVPMDKVTCIAMDCVDTDEIDSLDMARIGMGLMMVLNMVYGIDVEYSLVQAVEGEVVVQS